MTPRSIPCRDESQQGWVLLAYRDWRQFILALHSAEPEQRKQGVVIVAFRRTFSTVHLAVMFDDAVNHDLERLVGFEIVVLVNFTAAFSCKFEGFESDF
ncbi:hypothetical protein IPC838_18460 [Pseudomonas aeruginosa]|nr:hypothetical protein IPC838_18460 [Pseudomonas aeruginosa]